MLVAVPSTGHGFFSHLVVLADADDDDDEYDVRLIKYNIVSSYIVSDKVFKIKET